LKFEIYEGERKLIRDNKRLGGMILNNLPEKLKGQVKVDVTFEIDVDGVLKVTAIENSQNLTKEIKEINIGNMTQEEINKKIKEAEKLFKDDKNEENRIKSMLKLNDLLVDYTHKYNENEEIKKTLDQFRNWLKHSTQLPKEEYDQKIEELNKSIPKENEKKTEEKKEKKDEDVTEGKDKNIETNPDKIENTEGINNPNINEQNQEHTAV
jgi:molecular chaperone DnaK (HSP70)